MASKGEAAAGVALARSPRRSPVAFTAGVARAVCARVAAGEMLSEVCAQAGMPHIDTVRKWTRAHAAFGRAFRRARAFARRGDGLGPNTTFCEAVAHEICVRVSEGETLTSICADPAMPAMSTIIRWQQKNAAFLEGMQVARQAQAERMADEGMRMALAAAPEDARLLREQLAQLRWTVAIKAPRTHGGRWKAAEMPAEPKGPTTFLFKHFHLEEDPQTGLVRVVTYIPDPDSNQPMRDAEGPWKKRPGGLRTVPDQAEPGASLAAAAPKPIVNKPHDPEGWL